MPVDVKKFLSQGDRRLEKELLAKRYEMVTTEGKDGKDFRIKILKLYYKNELAEVSTEWLCPRKCLLVNCQSICSFEKHYALTKLCDIIRLPWFFWLKPGSTLKNPILKISYFPPSTLLPDMSVIVVNIVAVWLHSVQKTRWMY